MIRLAVVGGPLLQFWLFAVETWPVRGVFAFTELPDDWPDVLLHSTP